MTPEEDEVYPWREHRDTWLSRIFSRLRPGREVERIVQDSNFPEVLNFRPDQKAIDRLRCPTASEVISQAEPLWIRDRAYRFLSRWQPDESPKSKRFLRLLTKRDGHHYIEEIRGTALNDDDFLRELFRLMFELKKFESPNVPKLHEFGVSSVEYFCYRRWEDSSMAEVSASLTKGTTKADIIEFVGCLQRLRGLGLRVETLPLWSVRRQPGGPLRIYRFPLTREARIPRFCFGLAGEDLTLVDNLLEPSGDGTDPVLSFQFQLGTFCWKLLSDHYPYDRPPALLQKGEEPKRVEFDFGERLTPTLLRLTRLVPEGRFPDMETALGSIAEALR